MKTIKILILFTAALFTYQVGHSQAILTADNNPGAIAVPGQVFTGATAFSDAIAAANAGDIIHVVRSGTNYGAVTVDKQLIIFGVGLNPDTDGGNVSAVSTVLIADPAASGTRLSGLSITNQLGLGGVAGSLINLLVENGRIRWIQHLDASTTLSNVIIRNNVIGANFLTSEEKIDLLAGAIANITIANNVFFYTNGPHNNGVIAASNGTVVENNLFIGSGSTAYYAFEDFYGNTVKNNIFLGLRPQAVGNFFNNDFEHNLSFSTNVDAFSTENSNTSVNNIEGQDPLFTNVPLSGSINYSTFDPTLDDVTPSPAIGAGEGGTDMGVLGGTSPMDLEGTLIPTIQSITLPSIVVKGEVLPVQIKAKGN